GGQRLAQRVRGFRVHAPATRLVAGAVLGATALAIALGFDQRLTTAIPGYVSAIQKRVEDSADARKALDRLTGSRQPGSSSAWHAPDFRGISVWLNTPGGRPLSIRELRGKVVLVDFW